MLFFRLSVASGGFRYRVVGRGLCFGDFRYFLVREFGNFLFLGFRVFVCEKG